jgi:hypothetical protein
MDIIFSFSIVLPTKPFVAGLHWQSNMYSASGNTAQKPPYGFVRRCLMQVVTSMLMVAQLHPDISVHCFQSAHTNRLSHR